MTHATALLWIGVVLVASGELLDRTQAGRLVKAGGITLIAFIAGKVLVT